MPVCCRPGRTFLAIGHCHGFGALLLVSKLVRLSVITKPLAKLEKIGFVWPKYLLSSGRSDLGPLAKIRKSAGESAGSPAQSHARSGKPWLNSPVSSMACSRAQISLRRRKTGDQESVERNARLRFGVKFVRRFKCLRLNLRGGHYPFE